MFTRSLAAGALLALALCSVASAAAKPFPAPSGWDQVQQQTPSGGPQAFQMWKRGSGELQQTVTFLNDPSTSYDDLVQRIHKNIVDNKFKVSLDKDLTCDGKSGHLFSIAYGPDAHRVAVDRLIVPDGSGAVQITYMRPEPEPFANEVSSDLNGYCGSTVR